MTKQEIIEAGELMLDTASGKVTALEGKRTHKEGAKWSDCIGTPAWNWSDYVYRAKPMPREMWAVYRKDSGILQNSYQSESEAWADHGENDNFEIVCLLEKM